MPRSARKESGYGIYHVMMRGINRQAIFDDDEDCHRFMGILADLPFQHDDDGNLQRNEVDENVHYPHFDFYTFRNTKSFAIADLKELRYIDPEHSKIKGEWQLLK